MIVHMFFKEFTYIFASLQGRVASLGQDLLTEDAKRTDHCCQGADMKSSSLNQSMSSEEDEDMDVPELVEDIIEVLLTGLKDTVCLKGEIPFFKI